MQVTADVRSRPHSGYRHEALFVGSDDEFRASAVPFLQAGIAAGEPTLVALPPARGRMVREALGQAAAGVLFVDITRVGANPARLMPALRTFIDAAGDDGGQRRAVRVLGEPVWPGRRAAEVAECQLHEALLNMAIDPDEPVWLRCSYDVGALSAEITETARHSHPALVEASGYRGSTSYEGLEHARDLLRAPLPEPPVPVRELAFGAGDLRAVRGLVRAVVTDAGVDGDRGSDLELAVHEVALNSIQHGGGQGRLRAWRTADGVVAEVSDAGRITDPLVGRSVPDQQAETGRGLWLAHHFADLVQMRATAGGTTMRLTLWSGGEASSGA